MCGGATSRRTQNCLVLRPSRSVDGVVKQRARRLISLPHRWPGWGNAYSCPLLQSVVVHEDWCPPSPDSGLHANRSGGIGKLLEDAGEFLFSPGKEKSLHCVTHELSFLFFVQVVHW